MKNLFNKHDIDSDAEFLPGGTNDDAADRHNIGKIAADAEDNMIVLDQEMMQCISSAAPASTPTPDGKLMAA